MGARRPGSSRLCGPVPRLEGSRAARPLRGAALPQASCNLGAAARHASHAGLLSWDASWYERIAAHGYAGLGTGALRFFPLLPVLARSLRALPGMTAGMSVVFVANARRLRRFRRALPPRRLRARGRGVRPPGRVAARPRSARLRARHGLRRLLVAPRPRSPLSWASASAVTPWRSCAAFLAGLCRPVGVLLAIPAAVELGANWFALSGRERVKAAGHGAGGPARHGGLSRLGAGDLRELLAPACASSSRFRTEERSPTRSSPSPTIFSDLVHGSHLGVAEHGLWAVLFVLLALYVL